MSGLEDLHQELPGAESPALHRAFGNTNRLGSFLIGEPDHPHQHDGLPQRIVESCQRVPDLETEVGVMGVLG